MRSFLHLLTLVALLFAPLAAPAAAMEMAKVEQGKVECAEMEMAAPAHKMPANEHRNGEACCIAVPPAITPPLAALDADASIDHPSFVVKAEPFRLGAGPKAEDPPPRIA